MLHQKLDASRYTKALFDFREHEIDTSVADEFELASLAAKMFSGYRNQIARNHPPWRSLDFRRVLSKRWSVNRGLMHQILQ
jgi:hypothetical protein